MKPKIVKKDNSQLVKVKRLKFQKPDNWADDFYQKTQFILRNPKVLNDYKQMDEICKGAEFDFVTSYQAKAPYPIRYKRSPVTVQTKAGFSKKVFVSKGACRELTLFKAPKTSKDGQIRINIKEMTVLYIYNHGSYVTDITFRTAFEDVLFEVR